MPRKKDIEFEDLMPTQEETDFETFLEEVGPGTSTIDVFRALRDGSREHIDKVSVSVLQEDVYGFLRDSYGPGKYFLFFKGADRRYKGGKTLQVGAMKPETGTAVVRPNGNDSDHLAFMREQMAMQQNMITALITSMRGPDVGSLLQGIGALAPKTAVSDPAAMLTAVATVFTTLRGPEKDEDWLARAKTILELAQSMNGGNNGGEDSGWSVLKEVGKEVARKIDLSALASPGKAALPAAHVSDSISQPTSEATVVVPAKESNPQATIEQWLRASLQYLKTKAALNKDPGVYIEHIFDDPEEPQNAAIIEAIRKGATLEHLYAYDPEIGNNPFYRGWFERLYEGLRSELLQSAVDTSRSGGNAGDTPGDEKAGTGSE